jgi:hypothetical protein
MGLTLASLATPAAAQLPNQSFDVVPQVAHATVGDSVTLLFRVRLDEDLLYDSVPQPTAELPPGVRILSVEKLHRGSDRVFTGRAEIAFYRPGRQAVPVFGLPFMRAVKGLARAVVTSDSAFVQIDPVAPPGNPQLKDIKPIERQRGPDPRLVTGMLVAAAAAGLTAWSLRRRRRPPPAAIVPEATLAPIAELTPYDAAVARLAEIEAGPPPIPENVDLYYAGVVDTLRRYLEDAKAVAARTRTTRELIEALPPVLRQPGLREQCATLLGSADRVKFAGVRPNAHAAAEFVRDARRLLDDWHAIVPERAMAAAPGSRAGPR